MSKFIDLSAGQKDEIRRLTQEANRRIISAQKTYEKAGRTITPREVTGDIQHKKQWATEKVPLSRSVKFDSVAKYEAHIKMLRKFDKDTTAKDRQLTMTEYTKIQRHKIDLALNSSLGVELNVKFQKKLNKMDAPKLAEFWKKYSEITGKMGLQYSSDAAMMQAMEEFFGEDIDNMIETSLEG